jgi:hypothetical protein
MDWMSDRVQDYLIKRKRAAFTGVMLVSPFGGKGGLQVLSPFSVLHMRWTPKREAYPTVSSMPQKAAA